mgnify:CR=1 FL=1|jgi:hypothetical protein
MAIKPSKFSAFENAPIPPLVPKTEEPTKNDDIVDIDSFPTLGEEPDTPQEPETETTTGIEDTEEDFGDALLNRIQKFSDEDDEPTDVSSTENTANFEEDEENISFDTDDEENTDDYWDYYLSDDDLLYGTGSDSAPQTALDRATADVEEPFHTEEDEDDDTTDTGIADSTPTTLTIHDLPRDAEGAALLTDPTTGEYIPEAKQILLNLTEDEADNNLNYTDYEYWEKLKAQNNNEDEYIYEYEEYDDDEDQEEEHDDDLDDETNEYTEDDNDTHQQIGVPTNPQTAPNTNKKTLKDHTNNLLDNTAKILNKGQKLPLIGKPLTKVIPGTTTGRGTATITLLLLLLLILHLTNTQITGNKTYTPTGTTTINLPDNGKATLTGITRTNGTYTATITNQGTTNAYNIHGTVDATAATNITQWFTPTNLGTCTYTIKHIQPGQTAQTPLTCTTDPTGTINPTFTNATITTDEA